MVRRWKAAHLGVDRAGQAAHARCRERLAGERLGEPGGLPGREATQEGLAQGVVDEARAPGRGAQEGRPVAQGSGAGHDEVLDEPELGHQAAPVAAVAMVSPTGCALVVQRPDREAQLVLHRGLQHGLHESGQFRAQVAPQGGPRHAPPPSAGRGCDR